MALRITTVSVDCAARRDGSSTASVSSTASAERVPGTQDLTRAFASVGDLVSKVRTDQWSLPTPCTQWTVRQLVNHLVGMNRVFTAVLTDEAPPPGPPADQTEADPAGAYRASAAALCAAFERPGVLERTFAGPLGAASGLERLHIRLYDLLAHGWDLAHAVGEPAELPDDLSERSLAFVRVQLTEQARPGRFGPAQVVVDDAPAIERLVAFLGRPVEPGGAA